MSTVPSLSPREADFLERLTQGDTIQEIARDWHYGESGARSIGERMRKKLGAKTNAQAVFIACQLKILDPGRRHGDHPGYVAHVRRGEEPCDRCKAGERAYRAERRQKRRLEPSSARLAASQPVQAAREGRDAQRASGGRTAA